MSILPKKIGIDGASEDYFTHYFMQTAKDVAKKSTCFRRDIGCTLVSMHNELLSTGYNGSPLQLGDCKAQNDLCTGRYIKAGRDAGNSCYGIHAEIRALKDCRDIGKIYKMYSTKAPCIQCVLTLLTTPCVYIIFLTESNETLNKELWEKTGGVWVQYEG